MGQKREGRREGIERPIRQREVLENRDERSERRRLQSDTVASQISSSIPLWKTLGVRAGWGSVGGPLVYR